MKKLLVSLIIASAFATLNAQTSTEFNGYALYNQQNENTTYLIDKDGEFLS